MPIKLILSLSTVLIAFMSGWITHGWKYDGLYKKEYIETVKELNAENEKYTAVEKKNQDRESAYQQKMEKLNAEVKKEEQLNPVYGNCVVPNNGVQLINAAVGAAASAKATR